MKATELIAKLHEVVKDHGDVNISLLNSNLEKDRLSYLGRFVREVDSSNSEFLVLTKEQFEVIQAHSIVKGKLADLESKISGLASFSSIKTFLY